MAWFDKKDGESDICTQLSLGKRVNRHRDENQKIDQCAAAADAFPQIYAGTQRAAVHVARVLAEALDARG